VDQSPLTENKPSGPRQYSSLATYSSGDQVAVFESGTGTGDRATTGKAPLPLSPDQISARREASRFCG
jgi:hypothetical protein